MKKANLILQCIFIASFLVTDCTFAEEQWILEWWTLDVVQVLPKGTETYETDWIQQIFDIPETKITEFGKVLGPDNIGQLMIQGEQGSIDFEAGKYTVSVGGNVYQVEGADACRFTYQKLNGDFEISMKVESLKQVSPRTKSGLMVRQDNSPGSPNIFLAATENGRRFIFLERRGYCQEYKDGPEAVNEIEFPVWLKITRDMDDFTGAISPDGQKWSEVFSTVFPLKDDLSVGFAVASGLTGNLTTSVISNLSINGQEPQWKHMASEEIGILKESVRQFLWSVRSLKELHGANIINGIYEGEIDLCFPSDFVFYGMIAINSPFAQNTVLHFASGGFASVWINGQLAVDWKRGPRPRRVIAPFEVKLDEGLNLMLVRVSNGNFLNARFEAENLTFRPKDGAFNLPAEAFQPKPGKTLVTTWGEVKQSK